MMSDTKPSPIPVILLRFLVGDLDFTVISNNCWGAHIYQGLRIPYLTPFVGLFIPPKSYLYLLRNFDACMRSELVFVKEGAFRDLDRWHPGGRRDYPIGLLENQVEIHFLSYADAAEARAKWQRRSERIVKNRARWFVKFDDRYGGTAADVEEFFLLPFQNKVCFTKTHYWRPIAGPRQPKVGPGQLTMRYRQQRTKEPALPTVGLPVHVPEESDVPDGVRLAEIGGRYFNTLRWISTRPSKMTMPSVF
jgi:uncharacterized protein (DUF1919 family)